MNILFLHPNFPAQFKSPCIELAKDNHRIKFICQTHYGRMINGVEKLVLKGAGSHDQTILSSKSEYDRTLIRADIYRKSFLILKEQNWDPDVVIAHSGWGCGAHVKEIWPKVYFISYLEWWFDIRSDLTKTLKENPYFHYDESALQKLWIRNMPAAIEMCTANKIITPTEWQKHQLPALLKEHCAVIHDKIDKKLFFPEPKKISQSPVITYGTRGMEPMRCFPQFIQLLPKLLEKWPQLTVEVAGVDTINYGGHLPKEKSWKNWAVNILNEKNFGQRVKWRGRLPLDEYANWLKKTWCHVYISEPFITSWSYIEAMHCQIPMVSSTTKACLEFKELNPNCAFADHNNQLKLLEEINNKIRFFGSLKANDLYYEREQQIKRANLLESSETSLAKLIADVEAATKV